MFLCSVLGFFWRDGFVMWGGGGGSGGRGGGAAGGGEGGAWTDTLPPGDRRTDGHSPWRGLRLQRGPCPFAPHSQRRAPPTQLRLQPHPARTLSLAPRRTSATPFRSMARTVAPRMDKNAAAEAGALSNCEPGKCPSMAPRQPSACFAHVEPRYFSGVAPIVGGFQPGSVPTRFRNCRTFQQEDAARHVGS